jgi:hypothetical protein
MDKTITVAVERKVKQLFCNGKSSKKRQPSFMLMMRRMSVTLRYKNYGDPSHCQTEALEIG